MAYDSQLSKKHIPFFSVVIYLFFFYIKKKKIKYKSKNIFAMSGVDFLVKLHREGRIDASEAGSITKKVCFRIKSG